VKKKKLITLLAAICYFSTSYGVESLSDSNNVQSHYFTNQDSDIGYFFYPRGAERDFSWRIINFAQNPIKGSFYVDANYGNLYATWNNLLLASGQATPLDSSKNIGLGPMTSVGFKNNWIADLIFNGERYVLNDPNEQHSCLVQPWDIGPGLQVVAQISDTPFDPTNVLKDLNIIMPKSANCTTQFVNMGPAINTFHYLRKATNDFGWTVENDAPDTVTGSFDTSSASGGATQLYASWNNITLKNKQITPLDYSKGIGLGPYFISSHNYWTFNLEYKGKKYRAIGECNIQDSDLRGITHVYIKGDDDGLRYILIGRPTNWCDPMTLKYIAPASS
jgi:hypothetical protein